MKSGHRAVVGIDPGATGALVFLLHKNRDYEILPFSKSPMVFVFRKTRELAEAFNPYGYKEKVGAMPKDARSKLNLAEFMRNDGMARALLEYNGIPYEEITPQKWQLHHGLGGSYHKEGNSEGKDKTARKNAHKEKAQELFPQIKVTLEIADALLIAQYGWDKQFGV